MDPYLHTIIATGLLWLAYHIGRWRGLRLGIEATLHSLATLNLIHLTFDEDDNIEKIEATKTDER